jgi:hypothetical protein
MSSDLFFLSWLETKSLPRFVAASSFVPSHHQRRRENNNLTSFSHKKKQPCPLLPLTYGVNISVPIAGAREAQSHHRGCEAQSPASSVSLHPLLLPPAVRIS